MNHMLSEQWEERNKTQFKMKTFIQKVLSFDRGNDRSYGEILGTMDWLDIENAFIFLYKEPIIHLIGEPFELPDQLYLRRRSGEWGVPWKPGLSCCQDDQSAQDERGDHEAS